MQQITWSKDFSQINHKKVHFGYQRGPSCWNSLTVQYCGYHAIILWWVNRIKILMNSTFDILIKCNKSLEAKTSLRSTIGKLEIFWKAQTSWQLTSCLWIKQRRRSSCTVLALFCPIVSLYRDRLKFKQDIETRAGRNFYTTTNH